MCHNSTCILLKPHQRKHQRGIAIVTAIFLIVILAALAAFIVSMVSFQKVSSGLSIQGMRALQASQSGLEWGYWQVLNPASAPACPVNTNLAMPASSSIGTFTVTVTCTQTTHDVGGTNVAVYTFTANACNQPSAGVCPNASPGSDYVERQSLGMVAR